MYSLTILFLFFLLLPFAQAQQAFIDIHYSFDYNNKADASLVRLLDKAQITKNAKASFLAKLDSFRNTPFDIQARFIDESTTEHLVSSLQDPKTVGIVWVGHSQSYYGPKDDDGKQELFNTFILDAKKRYIPKGVFSANHSNLQFIAIPTCRLTDVTKRYNLNNREFNLYTPRTMDVVIHGHVEELTHILIGVKDSFEAVSNNLPAILTKYRSRLVSMPQPQYQNIQIALAYRDLKSSVYSYEVLLDDRLAGVFWSNQRKVGNGMFTLSSGLTTISAKIDSTISNHQMVIRPDDRHRKTVNYPKPVDDILLDQVTIVHQERTTSLLKHTVHIGDESMNVDVDADTLWLKHKGELENLPLNEIFTINFR